jgi:hypothetical protein
MVAGAAALTGCVGTKPRRVSANEKLNIAIIGAGGRGATNIKEVGSENIVALCDVNEEHLNAAASKLPKARTYVDFRKLYDESKDIDAVVVCTTEHTHAFAMMPAIQLKKHIYCEKPLAHSVWETRVITEAARKAGIVTQMGTQVHATNNFRRVVELVQTGVVGPVREVHVWVSRAWGDGDRPTETPPVPPTLYWDLWIGPAPMRPYHPTYIEGQPRWYKWWDFGGGTLPDLGSHWNDMAFWALKLDHPLTIEAHGPPPNPETAPASYHTTYEYGARGNLPPVKHTWYQGVDKPALWMEKRIPQWDNGVLFIGDKGMLLSDYGKHTLLPEDKFAGFKRPDPFIPDSVGHWKEWILACKTGKPTTCKFDYSGPLTEANHLGNVAFRSGHRIQWDAAKLKIRNCPEAERFLRHKYRKGWKLV